MMPPPAQLPILEKRKASVFNLKESRGGLNQVPSSNTKNLIIRERVSQRMIYISTLRVHIVEAMEIANVVDSLLEDGDEHQAPIARVHTMARQTTPWTNVISFVDFHLAIKHGTTTNLETLLTQLLVKIIRIKRMMPQMSLLHRFNIIKN